MSFSSKKPGSIAILIACVILIALAIFSVVYGAATVSDLTGVQKENELAGTGGICGVPAVYQKIFESAASGPGGGEIPSALIAAIFIIEHGTVESYKSGYTPTGKRNDRWPEENGDPNAITKWQSSSAGAQGPMQFLPSTFAQYGSGNIQNITDAANATAKMDKANYDKQSGSNEERLKKVIARYNPGAGPWNNSWYVDKVWNEYKTLCGGTIGGIASGSSIVEIAQREVGVTEHGCEDCGVEKYTNGRHERWCADFVSWVYNQAGYKFTPISGAKTLYNWFTKNQIGFARGAGTPQPGDVIYFTKSHVGIVEFVSGNTVHTIEGNAGNPGQVKRESYNLNNNGIGGYGRWKQ